MFSYLSCVLTSRFLSGDLHIAVHVQDPLSTDLSDAARQSRVVPLDVAFPVPRGMLSKIWRGSIRHNHRMSKLDWTGLTWVIVLHGRDDCDFDIRDDWNCLWCSAASYVARTCSMHCRCAPSSMSSSSACTVASRLTSTRWMTFCVSIAFRTRPSLAWWPISSGPIRPPTTPR